MADTLKQSIAELTGIKESDLKASTGVTPVRDWKNYLADEGYDIESHDARKAIKDRHIILYGDNRGQTQALLSDSEQAKHVVPLTRVTISKAGGKKEA